MPPFKGLIMKRLVLIASLLGFAVCMNPAIAKDTSEHLTAQQNKMSYCSKEAAAKDLHGDKRKEFMKDLNFPAFHPLKSLQNLTLR